MSAPASTITRRELLQRIRRWQAKHPDHTFRRYRPGTANFRRYGQAAVWVNGAQIGYGTLEAVCRAIGALDDGECTVDEVSRTLDVHDLMKRLGYDPNDEGAFIGVEQGLESGFPPCCIAFFNLIWVSAVLAERPTRECLWRITGDYRRLLDRAYAQGTLSHEGGYIPCPSCLLKLLHKSEGGAGKRQVVDVHAVSRPRAEV